MHRQILKIPSEQTGARLDTALAALLGIARSQAQKIIAQGQVQRNNQMPKKAGEKVKTGDELVIHAVIPAGPEHRRREAEEPLNKKVGLTPEPKIIAETFDYLVVEKPSGMLTHPTMAGETNTLVNWLLKKYPEIKGIRDALPSLKKLGEAAEVKTFRPGIVHRLDKEASGLLVVARTQKMFDHLKEQFKTRTVEKEYYALAHGKIAKDWDIITFPIARGKTYERMAARPLRSVIPTGRLSGEESLSQSPTDRDPSLDARNDSNEKQAKTEFLAERRFVNFTLLRVILHTGRMHQIRAHLLAYNHPLVGDPLYYQKKRKRAWDARLGRLFLHATKLSFTDLAGQRQTFESPLPEELEKFLPLIK
ncbi:MAG: RluA family pseudouridine synthase [Candidatus Magasanikbacteria bacterium]|nr:RluA family pseudouridine synthase [Candidatus Magasanikbacteria bacterium]